MKYRELLESYKNGKLEEEIRKSVEQDIEKQEAISEYLVDQMESEWDIKEDVATDQEETLQGSTEQEANKLTKLINLSIHKAFMKMGIAITAVLLCVMFFLMYGLSPLVSCFYYNPTKTAVEDNTFDTQINQMSLDYIIYSDLTMPENYRYNVNATSEGFGNYNFNIIQNMSIDGNFVNVGGEIQRGKMTLYNTNELMQPFNSMFAGLDLSGEGSVTDKVQQAQSELDKNELIYYWYYSSIEESMKALNNLEDEKYYYGYVTFENMASFQDLQEFKRQLPEMSSIEWCGVDANEGTEVKILGYNMHNSCSASSWKLDEYPDLNFYDNPEDFDQSNWYEVMDQKLSDESWCQSHMISMLTYLSNQKQFLELWQEESNNYCQAAEYVKENGLNYYGVVVYGTKEDLLKISQMDQVYGIYVK